MSSQSTFRFSDMRLSRIDVAKHGYGQQAAIPCDFVRYLRRHQQIGCGATASITESVPDFGDLDGRA
jgi:hypothetical protein